MSIDLKEFRIRKLHGTRTLRIPFIQDRVVLAGINGLGKTTVITLLYYLLSRQLRRLLEFQFENLELHFADTTIVVTHEEIWKAYFAAAVHRMPELFPAEVVERFQKHPQLLVQLLNIPGEATEHYRRLARTLDLPPSVVERLSEFVQYSYRETPQDREDLDARGRLIADQIQAQVVYLPTYRRIERDLRDIFPTVEDQLRRRRRYQLDRPFPRAASYLELIEFGMEDVAETFQRTEDDLRETSRASLTALVGTYLRAVIRGEVKDSLSSSLEQLDDKTVQKILDRVEERTLSEREKQLLREGISRWRTDPNHAISESEQYVSHFVSQLVALDGTLKEKEAPVLAFKDVCNGYLRGKAISYDERAYTLSVSEHHGSSLELRMLSSGEKQIVSLFSHLYLNKQRRYVVLIDEPELSLSVDWQRKLLPDILRTGRCAFLAAATHSPFIFENELDDSACDLAECIEDE